ncbi:DNA replication ATP-dependent helicase/nuclease DNA2-like [Haliotis rufescens]|uniref:DNA replication ATP-dependent helicase/nuclease DNA2-like n=1 Tax=Haliotis rufescens TaxID=6454 RepID=UPI00201FADE3|nr:DNA replication ATP-dependent helicase/nuclease DNA2-like [Haliotis rufescens]
MVKADKKKQAPEDKQDGDKQRSISSFFEKSSAPGADQRKLFSSVGSKLSMRKPSTSAQQGKPLFPTTQEKPALSIQQQSGPGKFTGVKQQHGANDKKCEMEPRSIPETQFLSPDKSCDPVAMVTESPDIMIPDTPEEAKMGKMKKKIFISRSFLSVNSNPITRAPPPKVVKKHKSMLTGMVSVSFNSPGDNSDDVAIERGLVREDAVLDAPGDDGSEAQTPTKTYKCDRVKRLAKSGISPSSKRTLYADSDVMQDRDTCSLENRVAHASDIKGKSKPLPESVPERKTRVERILSHMSAGRAVGSVSRKLTDYQLGAAPSSSGVSDGGGDDELLGEILGELGAKSESRAGGVAEKCVPGANMSRTKQRKVSQTHVDVGAMTEEELELFRTLDTSFEVDKGETTPESESPSIIMPRRKKKDIDNASKAPVMNLLLSHPSKVSHSGGLSQGSEVMEVKESSQGSEVMEVRTPSPTSSQDLCEELSHLSPFKDVNQENSPRLPDPGCAADRFNRYRVSAVSHGREEVVLNLESVGGGDDARDSHREAEQKCVLKGFWMDSHVSEGDIVHVLADCSDGVYHVTDRAGVIVVCPDLLLSGTSVVSGVFCMRRSVLNEKFKGSDDKSIHMLFGSIIHCLFQQVVKQGLTTEKHMLEVAKSVMKLNKFLHEMYSHVTNESVVLEEIHKYIPTLKKWVEKYSALTPQTLATNSSDVKVVKVHDIEENIWSPRFGVKGKIDMTVQVEFPKAAKQKKKVLPLELKTGRPTFSIEHKGQVTLYSMMMSDRREDPEEGLLLYLKEPVMTKVAVKGDNKRGLLQLRNELAFYVKQQVTKSVEDGHVTYQYGHLPTPINSHRSCSKCPQLLNCAIYQRHVEGVNHGAGHAMETLVPETLGHLQQRHVDYYLHWCVCLEMESRVARGSNITDIWCCSSHDREKKGDCLSGMVIKHTKMADVAESQRFAEGESCIVTFKRHPSHLRHFPAPLHTLGFSKNDSVAISSDDGRLLVLSSGFIYNISEGTVDIVVDRGVFHEDPALRNITYRLDRCDNFNTLGYLFTNLSRLLTNQHSKERLRELIIDKKKPQFQLTMSKGTIEKVKPIFKSLNKPQKAVILKILMSKDYVLIKGYPGTGKTSTIVALVRILSCLGLSVLLTSYTHSAVDNILLKLKKLNVNFLRLGRLGRIHPDLHDHAGEVLTSKITSVHELRTFYESQNIVATSCLGVNHPIFSQRRFDVCIVDEASQVLQPACLGPLFAADRFVLVGDPKQLPPVVQSREARELGMGESLFARLDDAGATFDLNLQYRMNKTIMHLSNELMYSGLLQCGSSEVADTCLVLPEPSVHSRLWLDRVLTSDLQHAAIFLDTNKVPAPESSDGKGMLKNTVEAELVLIIVASLVQCGLSMEDIGVIAPYRHQVKLLQQLLHQRHLVAVEANTVDQYQGRDKSIIIMSFVRSSSQNNKSGELLQDIRRLNVAVTRAKHKLILVGDASTLRQFDPLLKVITTMEHDNQILALPPDAHG